MGHVTLDLLALVPGEAAALDAQRGQLVGLEVGAARAIDVGVVQASDVREPRGRRASQQRWLVGGPQELQDLVQLAEPSSAIPVELGVDLGRGAAGSRARTSLRSSASASMLLRM